MLESFNTDKFEYKRLSLEEQEKRGILGRLVGKIADTNNATRNGRHYSNELWENVFNDPIMQEKIDNHLLLGNLGHPAEDEEISMEKAAVCMAERPKKGKDGFLYGVFDILSTPCGKILKSLCDYGCNVAISSRGSGDIIYDDNGNEAVDPDTYVCETFDVVVVPGVEQARLQYVNEALDTKKRNKTLRQKLSEDLDKASEEDKKIMTETLKDLDINLEEKLVQPSEEDLASIEAKFAELGLEIEGKGETLFGNKHYQLRKELDHKVTKEDLGPIFDALCDLDREDMPTVCNVGVHRDGDNIISASLDVLEKRVDEELEDEDGWGEEIPERLESIFGEIEDVMYEVRNCRRGAYGIRGDNVNALVSKLNTIADELSMEADDLESDEDRLNESKEENQLLDKLNKINELSEEILSDEEYEPDEEDQLAVDNIIETIAKLKDLKNKLKGSVEEDCSDKEVNEDAGNAGLIDQLQEALTKSAQLEKDNLSLQEQLSVCNAKEVKLEEELGKYRKATANLSESTKTVRSLKEELESLKGDLKKKDKLLESKDVAVKNYKQRLSSIAESNKGKLDESVSKVADLESKVKELTEQLEEKSTKLDKVTSVAKKYQSALKESKNSYIKAKAEAYGIDEESIRSQLKESYTLKDIDSICEELSEYKRNMSKLPFRINENMKLNFKSSGDYINKKSDYLDDDNVSQTLLSFID